MVAPPPPPAGPVPWRASLEIFAIQIAGIAAGTVLMLLTPMGLAPLMPWAAAATLLGAWAWSVRIGRARGLLERPALRVVARRTGLLGGAAVGFAYVGIATVPGQLTLPWLVVGVVALALAAGGGFATLVLTLCGMDAARSEPTSPSS